MSLDQETIMRFRSQVEAEWSRNIAPFWLKHALDQKYGGFYGWISNDLQIDEQADKGVVLTSRILWTFSRAYRIYANRVFGRVAKRAFEYLKRNFVDREHGGVFWTVDYSGKPANTTKRVYAHAFALFGLTEFFMAFGEQAALDQALVLFRLIESRFRDCEHDGYFETFECDWTPSSDQRLTTADHNEQKSMNSHLHILECYTTLAHTTRDPDVRKRLHAIIDIFLSRIINPHSFHFHMFFDAAWRCKTNRISFGHDIEGSWLLCEAAETLKDAGLLSQVRIIALRMARAVFNEALETDGSLVYEADLSGVTDDDRHWWAQSEAVVGFVNAYQLSGDKSFLTAAIGVWNFINQRMIDREHSEWFWKVSRAGEPARNLPKLSQWKCPYHNGRMCFEIRQRLSEPPSRPTIEHLVNEPLVVP